MKNILKKRVSRTVEHKIGDFSLSLDFENEKLQRIRVTNYSGYHSDRMSFDSVAEFRSIFDSIETLIKEEVK